MPTVTLTPEQIDLIALTLGEHCPDIITRANTPPAPFPADGCCPVDRAELVLIEEGHEREWSLTYDAEEPDPIWIAHFHGLEDYSEDGDGEYFTRCRQCLRRYSAPPDDWGWD